MRYYKRYWNEPTASELSKYWRCSWWYFEADESGVIHRQIEQFDNGRTLRYSEAHPADKFGALGDQPLDLTQFSRFEIPEEEFRDVWDRLE
jgi:hypothetical protein